MALQAVVQSAAKPRRFYEEPLLGIILNANYFPNYPQLRDVIYGYKNYINTEDEMPFQDFCDTKY